MRGSTLGATYPSVCFSNTGVYWKSSSKSNSDDDNDDDDVLIFTQPMLYARHCAKGVYVCISHFTLKKKPVRYQYIGRLDNLPVVCHKPIFLIILLISKPTQEDLTSIRKEYCLTLNT